ncbi:MAG TPA: alpha/beta hydrolase [Jatrophihabitans sp.]
MRSSLTISSGRIATLDTGVPAGAISATVAARALPTVLFVPGYTGSKEDFQPLLRPLAAAGYRAMAIDQRGQYESQWAPMPQGYTIDALAADLVEIAAGLAEHAERLHLVGHSFGGLVARAAVLSKPDLFDSVTLMSSGPASIGGLRRELLDAMDAVYSSGGMEAVWVHMEARAQADPKYRKSPPALLAFLRTRFLANDPLGLTVMGIELRSAADLTEQLAEVRMPKLVLHGVTDDAWPPSVQATMATRLGARHVAIEAAAHSPAVENPDATLAALHDFWQH